MLGNDLLTYRFMKDRQDRLLEEGRRQREAHAARRGARRRPVALRRLGRALVTLGHSLEGAELRARPLR